MKKILVWDIAVRVFHWLLSGAFLTAFIIAISLDEDASLFTLHALFGLVALSIVVFRLVWSIIGTKHAKLSSLFFSPMKLLRYVFHTLQNQPEKFTGHNPGSGTAAIAMYSLIVGIVLTGLLQVSGNDVFEEVHEILAYCMIAVVSIHLIGIVVYSWQHREFIGMSMISGKKTVDVTEESVSPKLSASLLMIVLCFGWLAGLARNYNAVNRQVTLPIIGTSISLGESEGGVEQGDKEHDDDD